MPKVKLSAGAELDLLSKDELDHSLKEAEAREVASLRGIKDVRFMLVGTVSSSAITLGDPSTGSAGGIISGPHEGYVWSIKHLVIEGLTSSATSPDQIWVYRNTRVIWALNGNQFCQTWGSGQIMVKPGEVIYFKNNGNLAATGQITVHGTAWNCPAELVGKLF